MPFLEVYATKDGSPKLFFVPKHKLPFISSYIGPEWCYDHRVSNPTPKDIESLVYVLNILINCGSNYFPLIIAELHHTCRTTRFLRVVNRKLLQTQEHMREDMKDESVYVHLRRLLEIVEAEATPAWKFESIMQELQKLEDLFKPTHETSGHDHGSTEDAGDDMKIDAKVD